jgi:hypothetical protein
MDGMTRLADDLDAMPSPEPAIEREKDMELDPPVEFQKKKFTSIHLEEPNGAAMEAARLEVQNGENPYTAWRFQVTLIAKVAKVPREVVLAMRKSEIDAAFAFLAPLLLAGSPTGES